MSRSAAGSPRPEVALVATTTPLLSRKRHTAEESSSPASAWISWLNVESSVNADSTTSAPRSVPGVAPGIAMANA